VLIVNVASCVREQAAFVVKLGESVLQLQRNYRQHVKTLKTLAFKIPLLPRTDGFLIYSTLSLTDNSTVHRDRQDMKY
jgi:hypothetical protein